MGQTDLSKLTRALRGQSPQHPTARRVFAEATARDMHPTRGSRAILQTVQGGGRPKQIASLNVRRADGTQGPIFCWGIAPFGWGKGEWE